MLPVEAYPSNAEQNLLLLQIKLKIVIENHFHFCSLIQNLPSDVLDQEFVE